MKHSLSLFIKIIVSQLFRSSWRSMEREGVQLLTHGPTYVADKSLCIVCQKAAPQATTSTVNGRKRILEASRIRNDIVSKRLKYLEDEHHAYHMNNECYKREVHFTKNTWQNSVTESEKYRWHIRPNRHNVRSRVICRPGPSKQLGFVKHQDIMKNVAFPSSIWLKSFWKPLYFSKIKCTHAHVTYKMSMQCLVYTYIIIKHVSIITWNRMNVPR